MMKGTDAYDYNTKPQMWTWVALLNEGNSGKQSIVSVRNK